MQASLAMYCFYTVSDQYTLQTVEQYAGRLSASWLGTGKHVTRRVMGCGNDTGECVYSLELQVQHAMHTHVHTTYRYTHLASTFMHSTNSE
jgi:hypothetical protein